LDRPREDTIPKSLKKNHYRLNIPQTLVAPEMQAQSELELNEAGKQLPLEHQQGALSMPFMAGQFLVDKSTPTVTVVRHITLS